MDDYKDSKRGLDPSDDCSSTSKNKEKYLNERIYFRKKFIFALKEIKRLVEANEKKNEYFASI